MWENCFVLCALHCIWRIYNVTILKASIILILLLLVLSFPRPAWDSWISHLKRFRVLFLSFRANTADAGSATRRLALLAERAERTETSFQFPLRNFLLFWSCTERIISSPNIQIATILGLLRHQHDFVVVDGGSGGGGCADRAGGGPGHQESVQQSRLSSQFAFQCRNLPQLLNTQKNVQFHLNLHFKLKFWLVQNGFQI